MKILFLLIFLLSIPLLSQELKYEEVVTVDSTITKEELYNRARSWYADNYKSEKDVMSIDDKSLGEISGNGAIRYEPRGLYFGALCAVGYISYKINIYVKDGRYKYNLHSFIHEGTRCSGGGSLVSYGLLTEEKEHPTRPNKGWREVKELAKTTSEILIKSLKEAMSRKHETSKDW